MAFKHPAENYAKYLFFALSNPEQGKINEQLRLLGMAPLQTDQFVELRDAFPELPAGVSVLNKSDKAGRAWLRSVGIYGLVHRDRSIEEVFTLILGQRNVREKIEALLLGRVSPQEITFRLKKQRLASVPPAVIEDFRHYFWNTTIMGVSDWANYFSKDSGGGRTQSISDEYMTALLGGSKLALYRTGMQIEISNRDTLDEMKAELWALFKEAKTLPLSGKKVEMISVLIRSYLKVDERLAMSDAAIDDTLEKFSRFKVKSTESNIPSLADLAVTGTASDNAAKEILRSKEK